jgi:hypothetical protein
VTIIQHLGAAVLLCWDELPRTIQKLILDRANDTVGMVPVLEIRDQIADLLCRRGKRNSSSGLLQGVTVVTPKTRDRKF